MDMKSFLQTVMANLAKQKTADALGGRAGFNAVRPLSQQAGAALAGSQSKLLPPPTPTMIPTPQTTLPPVSDGGDTNPVPAPQTSAPDAMPGPAPDIKSNPSVQDIYQNKLDELNALDSKDYKGADMRPHHNFLDILKGVGLGALKGAQNVNPNGGLASTLGSLLGGAAGGGIGESVDRNWINKTLDDTQKAKIMSDIGQLAPILKNQQEQALNQERIRTSQEDDKRQRDNLDRLKLKDANITKRYDKIASQRDLQLATAEELNTLRDKWQGQNDATKRYQLGLVEKEMQNRNDRSQAQIDSRERIAGQRVQSTQDIANSRIANSAQNRTLREQIHKDVMSQGRDKVLLNARNAYVKYQQSQGRTPSEQDIQNHIKNVIIPFIDGTEAPADPIDKVLNPDNTYNFNP